MRRFAYVFVGLILFAAAAGVLGYRLMNEPAWQERYAWLMGKENAASPQDPAAEAMRPQGGDDAQMRSLARRGEDRRSARDQFKLLQLGLDIANVLVGVVGIYLTLNGMRMRRQARA